MNHAKPNSRRVFSGRKFFAPLRLCASSFFLSLAVGSFHSATFGQERANFIVVAKPQHLTILNQYKQQLSSEEKAAFTENSPFRILDDDEPLGDELTRCMKVELLGIPYYIVKEDTGGLAGESRAGVSKALRNVSVLSDTILIVKHGTVTFLNASTRSRTTLKQSEQLMRVFQSSRLTFARTIPSGTYGWVDLKDTKGKDWIIVTGARTGTSKNLREYAPEIQLKLNVVNNKLTKLYDVLNRKSSEKRTPPQWMLQSTDAGLQCVLPSDTLAQFYRESTRWLAKEIELLVLGTRLRVDSSPGRIDIR